MRKSFWIVLALLVAGIAPVVHADSFSVTFTCTTSVGCPDPTASNVTFPSPKVDIEWQAVEFTVTLSSSDLPTDSYTWSGNGCSGLPGVCLTIIDHTTGSENISPNTRVGFPIILGGGDLTFTPVTAPEPASLLLVGSGLLGVAGIKRRRSSC